MLEFTGHRIARLGELLLDLHEIRFILVSTIGFVELHVRENKERLDHLVRREFRSNSLVQDQVKSCLK